jgi:hypothetical protein
MKRQLELRRYRLDRILQLKMCYLNSQECVPKDALERGRLQMLGDERRSHLVHYELASAADSLDGWSNETKTCAEDASSDSCHGMTDVTEFTGCTRCTRNAPRDDARLQCIVIAMLLLVSAAAAAVFQIADRGGRMHAFMPICGCWRDRTLRQLLLSPPARDGFGDLSSTSGGKLCLSVT